MTDKLLVIYDSDGEPIFDGCCTPEAADEILAVHREFVDGPLYYKFQSVGEPVQPEDPKTLTPVDGENEIP